MNSILVQVKMMIQMMKVGLDLSVLVFFNMHGIWRLVKVKPGNIIVYRYLTLSNETWS